jgi:hypothetical protein
VFLSIPRYSVCNDKWCFIITIANNVPRLKGYRNIEPHVIEAFAPDSGVILSPNFGWCTPMVDFYGFSFRIVKCFYNTAATCGIVAVMLAYTKTGNRVFISIFHGIFIG